VPASQVQRWVEALPVDSTRIHPRNLILILVPDCEPRHVDSFARGIGIR